MAQVLREWKRQRALCRVVNALHSPIQKSGTAFIAGSLVMSHFGLIAPQELLSAVVNKGQADLFLNSKSSSNPRTTRWEYVNKTIRPNTWKHTKKWLCSGRAKITFLCLHVDALLSAFRTTAGAYLCETCATSYQVGRWQFRIWISCEVKGSFVRCPW